MSNLHYGFFQFTQKATTIFFANALDVDGSWRVIFFHETILTESDIIIDKNINKMIRNKNQLQEPKKGTETPFFNDIFQSQVTGKDYLLFGMHSHSFSESSIEKNNAEVVNQSFHFSPHDTNEQKKVSHPYFEKKQGTLCSAAMNHRIETKKQSIKKILYSFIDNIDKYQLDHQFRKQLKERLQIDKVKNNRDCLKDLDLNVKRTECKSQDRKKSSPYKWVKIKIDRRSCQKKSERSYTYRNSNKPANSPRIPSTARYYMNKG